MNDDRLPTRRAVCLARLLADYDKATIPEYRRIQVTGCCWGVARMTGFARACRRPVDPCQDSPRHLPFV